MKHTKGSASIAILVGVLVVASIGLFSYETSKKSNLTDTQAASGTAKIAEYPVQDSGMTNVESDKTISTDPKIEIPASAKSSATNLSDQNKRPDPTVIAISSCMTISSPGNYYLANDISITGNTCLNISNTHGVTVDCQNHTILGDSPIFINGSSNVTVKKCTVNHSPTGGGGLSISNSHNVNIVSNIFNSTLEQHYSILVNDSSFISLMNNDIQGFYQQNFSSSSLLQNNHFTVPTPLFNGPSALIVFNHGFSNQAKGNIIDGSASGDNTIYLGADDGIVVGDESNTIILNNNIKNVYDCGIETLGTVQNSTFESNTITNAGFCGIGGWYWSSLLGNTFRNNISDNTLRAFIFFRTYGLRPDRTENGHNLSADTAAYLKDNQFISNIFLHPRSVPSYSPYSSDFQILPVDSSNINSGEQPVTDSDIFASNNIFTNNNFDLIDSAPLIWPNTIGVDGGGNRCGSVFSSPQLDYTTNPYPISCYNYQSNPN